MPWVRAQLREQLVYARANDDGSLRVEGGVVEIRYKPTDGRKYQARAANLKVTQATLLPDDACASAEAVVRDAAASPTSSPGSSPSSGRGKVDKTRAAASIQAVPAGALVAYTDGACSGNPGPAGLGVEIKGTKSPHWSGTLTSPRTYGHFGGSGTFLWVDPERGVACAVLTEREFGDWAKDAWPRLSDAVLAELG